MRQALLTIAITMRSSRTAEYVALFRALETLERAPRFRDPFASSFLPRKLRLAVRAAKLEPARRLIERVIDARAPGTRGSLIGRTCFIDDVVRDATKRGVSQVVILGAGFDCRAHRMPELCDARVFEVDQEKTQSRKRSLLTRSKEKTRADVRYVSVDFLRESTAEKLAAAGFRQDTPAVFVWEGVTNYLSERAVLDVLRWIGTSAPGSSLVFTYMHRGVLDDDPAFEAGIRVCQQVRDLDEPWIYGIYPDDLPSLLEAHGLTLREQLGADEYRTRYPAHHHPDPIAYPFSRIALATR